MGRVGRVTMRWDRAGRSYVDEDMGRACRSRRGQRQTEKLQKLSGGRSGVVWGAQENAGAKEREASCGA